jgi:hypothetical protein
MVDTQLKYLFRRVAASGIVVNYRAALHQHCSAIHHHRLPGAESFLHQK